MKLITRLKIINYNNKLDMYKKIIKVGRFGTRGSG